MSLRNSILAVAVAALCVQVSAPTLAAQAKKKEATVAKPDPTVAIPEDLQPKLEGLAPTKREFVTSGKAARFMPTKALLERFRNSTPQEIEVMIDAMLSVVEQSKYHDGTDPASIPLNTQSESFNSWKVKRPTNLDPKREPGPINLSRYAGGRGGGIPTFAGAPVAMTPEDLRAGKVDIAIVGAPLDMGSGYRGAKGGP